MRFLEIYRIQPNSEKLSSRLLPIRRIPSLYKEAQIYFSFLH